MPGVFDAIQLKSSSQGLSLDRTLGTVASITITIGIYRVLSAAMKSNGGRMSSSGLAELIKVTIGSLLLGNGANKLMQYKEHMESGLPDNGVLVNLKGSCHCRSVSFMVSLFLVLPIAFPYSNKQRNQSMSRSVTQSLTQLFFVNDLVQLKAPKTVLAKDCNGKIRYPHCMTSADNFQLMSGTKYLSVYYVNLAETHNGPVVAAHTFCSRCGVHILRAPNSNTDKLEVNTNCLEDRNNVKEVKVEDDFNDMSLGRGKALESRLRRQPATPNHGLHVVKDDDSSWMEDDEFLRTIEKRQIPSKIYKSDTPGTSETTAASSFLLPADSEEASYSDVSSLHSARSRRSFRSSRSKYSQSNAPHYNRGGGMNNLNADTTSISGWAVGSSLRSDSMKNHRNSRRMDDGISLPSMPYRDEITQESRNLPSSAVFKDKLKHYMKKHKNSGRRTEAIAEENGIF